MTQHIDDTSASRVVPTRALPLTGFVRISQIIGPHGPLPISRSGFWAGVKTGKFPKSRKISPRVTVWKAEDIHALIARIEESVHV